jgi:putative transposase
MPRTRRQHRRNFNIAGHAHVLTFSCYRGYEFLRSDRTCQWLADAINDARQKLDFALWAYVFMQEHVHLIIYPRSRTYDIAGIRHAIKHPVGEKALRFLAENSPEWLPRITRKRGQKIERLFWQSGGGYDRNIDQPTTLAKEIEYLHMNPVRRGLVECAAEWKWSSAGWFAGIAPSLLVPDPIHVEWVA